MTTISSRSSKSIKPTKPKSIKAQKKIWLSDDATDLDAASYSLEANADSACIDLTLPQYLYYWGKSKKDMQKEIKRFLKLKGLIDELYAKLVNLP